MSESNSLRDSGEMLDTWSRRFGSNRVHAIRVPSDLVYPALAFGAPCEALEGPIVARCGTTLRGQLIRIPDEHVEGWRKQRHTCSTCEYAVRNE